MEHQLDYVSKMEKALTFLEEKLSGIRTNRVSPKMLEDLKISLYGAKTALSHVARVESGGGRSLLVHVWDGSAISAVEKGILEANLGVTPSVEGSVIRVNFPEMTKERRHQMEKLVKTHGEEAQIALRNIRRDFQAGLSKEEHLSEDELHRQKKASDETTRKFADQVDKMIKEKVKEILPS